MFLRCATDRLGLAIYENTVIPSDHNIIVQFSHLWTQRISFHENIFLVYLFFYIYSFNLL